MQICDFLLVIKNKNHTFEKKHLKYPQYATEYKTIFFLFNSYTILYK